MTNLSSLGKQLCESVVQVVVSVEAQSDCCTAEDGHDGQRHLQCGYGPGWSGFAVAASRQQVDEQHEEGEDEPGGREGAEDT